MELTNSSSVNSRIPFWVAIETCAKLSDLFLQETGHGGGGGGCGREISEVRLVIVELISIFFGRSLVRFLLLLVVGLGHCPVHLISTHLVNQMRVLIGGPSSSSSSASCSLIAKVLRPFLIPGLLQSIKSSSSSSAVTASGIIRSVFYWMLWDYCGEHYSPRERTVSSSSSSTSSLASCILNLTALR